MRGHVKQREQAWSQSAASQFEGIFSFLEKYLTSLCLSIEAFLFINGPHEQPWASGPRRKTRQDCGPDRGHVKGQDIGQDEKDKTDDKKWDKI